MVLILGFATDNSMPTVKNRTINYPLNDWKHENFENVYNYIEKNSEQLAAVLIEPIQCTAGDIHLGKEVLKSINNICIKKDICFICDEIQTGFELLEVIGIQSN